MNRGSRTELRALRAEILRTAPILLFAVVVIALVRGPLFAANRQAKESSDVYVLPPPRETVLLSLGYRSALADVLWANTLVSQGLHTFKRRRFENLIRLLDTINELEPTYREPYAMADALITFQSSETPVEEIRKAREIMERGVKNRPLDAELWLGLGEFVALIAPGTYLSDPDEQARWKRDGAQMLIRAAELGGHNADVGWQTLSAASLLTRAGEHDKSIQFLQTMLALTDDPALKEQIQGQLDLRLQRAKDRVDAERVELFRRREELLRRLDDGIVRLRHSDLPHVTRLEFVVLGPPRDPAACAGRGHLSDPSCAPSFREWELRTEAQRTPSTRSNE